MAEGKALRAIRMLDGRSWAPGEIIPAVVIAKIKPEALRQLVVRGDMAVDGVDAGNSSSPGQLAHLTARLDKQADQIKRLESQVAELKAANVAPAPPKTRRAQRQAATTQE
jgi:hypothetical protein